MKKWLDEEKETEGYDNDNIKAQFIGDMFDDIPGEDSNKITVKLRLIWFWRGIKDAIYDTKRAIRNQYKWRKTINTLYPYEGFSGILSLMTTHLKDYVEYEEKFGHATAEYKKSKIDSAKEALEILERMKEPDEYLHKKRKEVETRYPEYKGLVTKYENGGSSYSGDFMAQGNGWVGEEGGKDPRRGYFEFIDGIFQLKKSPALEETNRLLAQLDKYHEEIENGYKQGHTDSDNDFDRLAELFKNNLYSWWD